MKTAFIVNPTAGRNKTRKLWPALELKLRAQVPGFSVFFTSCKGNGGEIAAQIQQQGYERLVIVGGDGTLHEVVNGIDPSHAVIGIIPTGTGNDFCRSVGIPLDPFAAPEYIFYRNFRKFDLGSINGHLFVNVAGVGFDAEVAREVNTNPFLKHFTGTGAYLAAVLKKLIKLQNTPVTISVDGRIKSGEIFLAAVGNASYYGGGFKIVPPALPDDGLFHVCMACNVNLVDAFTTLPKMFSGRHMEHPKVSCMSGKHVLITATEEMMVHADGEIVSETPAEFRILPGALTVVYPPG